MPKIKRRTAVIFYVLFIELLTICSCWVVASYLWRQKYDAINCNCVDMSYAWGSFFKSVGVPVQMVYGSHYEPNHSSAHCWLLLFGNVEFESTTLLPRFWNKNSDYYEVNIMEEIK